MREFYRHTLLGILLISISAVLYFVHYLIFHDSGLIMIYLVSDIAFIPLEVFLVTLVIERFLKEREKKNLLSKLNMVIGAFFSEVGSKLLSMLAQADPEVSRLREHLLNDNAWSDDSLRTLKKAVAKHEFNVDMTAEQLEELRIFIHSKRNFLLRLLENPNLLEHASFSELLWSVFHLSDELGNRQSLLRINELDRLHLCNDNRRAYQYLLLEWLDYMKHLKKNYPFLFSFALRTNPFASETTVEISE